MPAHSASRKKYIFYLYLDVVLAFGYLLYIFLFSMVIIDIDTTALTQAIVLCSLYAFDFLSST